MSPRAAKILGTFLFATWIVGFYYGFFLGLIAAILVTVFICECLKKAGLLPPKSPTPGERDE